MNAMPQFVRRSLVAAALLSPLFAVGCKEEPVDQPQPMSVLYSEPIATIEADSVRGAVGRTSQDTNIIATSQAAQTAQAEYPGSDMLGINLNYDTEDSLVYECVVRHEARYYVVVINPYTGTVVRSTQTDSAYYNEIIVPHLIVFDVRAIIRQIRTLMPNAMTVECNMEQIENRPTYVVIMLTGDNRYAILFIDAQTGKERRLTFDGYCNDDDKHKNKKGKGHYRHGKGHGYGHYYHCNCDCDD